MASRQCAKMGPPAATALLPAIAALVTCNAHAQGPLFPPLVYRVSLPVIPVQQVVSSPILTDQTLESSDQLAVVLTDDDASILSSPLARQAPHKPDCPYCDSSIYPYCSDKLLHDACCCLSPYNTDLPPQCQLADCSFLHANSCKEHRLITRCCCDRRLQPFLNRI